jgi:hypothetical protein
VRRALLLVVLLGLLAPVSADALRRTVPQGWNGMVLSRDQLGSDSQATTEWNRMVSSGVESTRIAFYWSTAQPYASITDVPPSRLGDFAPPNGTIGPGNVPTDFRRTDEVVESTAARGLAILPVVLNAPAWAAQDPGRLNAGLIAPPRDPQDYANYLTALVDRYGPNGTFWIAHPDVPKHPIREYQAWNEINLHFNWPQTHRQWVGQYTRLLRAAHDAIKAADPSAKVVLSALVNDSWRALPYLYKAHARGLFDSVAIHPYTLQPKNVVRVAKLIRGVMRRYHDSRKSLMITELGWPNEIDAHGHHRTRKHYTIDTSERGQVQRIKAVYPLLAKARRSLLLSRVYWYTWITSDRGNTDPFDYAGLRIKGIPDSRPKASFGVWRKMALGLEGCRSSKSSVTSCG